MQQSAEFGHVICVGNLTLEIFTQLHQLPHSGEAVAARQNLVRLGAGVGSVAQRLAEQGLRTLLISRLGRDAIGDLALSLLRQNQVNVGFVRRDFNCKSALRQIFSETRGVETEIMHNASGCELSAEDVLAAKAMFLGARALVLETTASSAARNAALELAQRYSVEVRYADLTDTSGKSATAEPFTLLQSDLSLAVPGVS